VLAIARVAGETAPIMFTAAFIVSDTLPWQVQKWTDFFFQGVMALPYHIYVVARRSPRTNTRATSNTARCSSSSLPSRPSQ